MNGRVRKGRDMLERIAALLLSLASLAEHVATRAAPIRLIVLWLLRQAERVAADFVATDPDAAFWEDWLPIAPDRSGYGPADALALALSFRLLALGVQAMAAAAGRLPAEAAACMGRIRRIALGMTPAVLPTVELCDTS
ncbi:MAG: hypothetical protein Q8Q62_19005 [Mesorhizobium sp.]|nr:hypothetical protein [Mesorhizobium sp.]